MLLPPGAHEVIEEVVVPAGFQIGCGPSAAPAPAGVTSSMVP